MAFKISKREKIGIALAAAAVSIFLAVQLVAFPLVDGNARLTRAVASRQADLAKIQELKTDFDRLMQSRARSLGRLKQRDPKFTLYSFLDGLSGQIGIKDRVVYMKPSSTTVKEGDLRIDLVEIKLQNVSLSKLVDYLGRIESSPNEVVLRRLTITRGEKADARLTAVLQAQTLVLPPTADTGATIG